MAVARRRLIDAARRRRNSDAAAEHVRLLAEELADAAAADHPIPDDSLGLMFACAHPAIDPAIRAPLMLQTVLGLDAARIAAAFLTSPATMAQRLVRAKHRSAGPAFPCASLTPSELPARLDAVLTAIYAGFAEGWTDADRSPRPRRRSHLARPSRRRPVARRTRGPWPARPHAARRGAPPRPARRNRRLRAARRAGHRGVGQRTDR